MFEQIIARHDGKWVKVILTSPIMVSQGLMVSSLQGKLVIHPSAMDCLSLELPDGTTLTIRMACIVAVSDHDGDVSELESSRRENRTKRQVNEMFER